MSNETDYILDGIEAAANCVERALTEATLLDPVHAALVHDAALYLIEQLDDLVETTSSIADPAGCEG